MRFSIVMATLNSMRTLEPALKALRAQDYAQDQIEILVVDGGSNDGTRELAEKYGCRVIDNPRVDPVSAKLIGMREARGIYLMHVDSDEVLMNRQALNKREQIFAQRPEIKMIFATGYQNPEGIPFAARYINEFGDPFSMFYYRLSKDARFFLPALKRRLKVTAETSAYMIFELGDRPQPILENAACGNCIDVAFFRREFPELCDKPWGPVHFFYHMQKFTRSFAVTKDDAILHYSADGWSGFLRKIKSRVRNNVFFPLEMGAASFLGRAQFDSTFTRLKKYLFIPYAFLLVPALIDAVILAWTRRDFLYLKHVSLCIYTAALIVGMKLLKLIGYRPAMKSYGEQKTILGARH